MLPLKEGGKYVVNMGLVSLYTKGYVPSPCILKHDFVSK